MKKTKIDEEWATKLAFKVIDFLKKELKNSNVPPVPSTMLVILELSKDLLLLKVVEKMVTEIAGRQIAKQVEKLFGEIAEKIEEMRERPLRAIVTLTNQSNMECN